MKASQSHSFPAFYYPDSKILILGSFPSVKSREHGFYYMHPQNRFYKILSNIFGEDFYFVPIEKKKELLKKYHIALYDVLESCDIEGSSDASISNCVPIDLEKILFTTQIKVIFINGQKAASLFLQYFKEYEPLCVILPSTSPANAKVTLEEITRVWKRCILAYQ